MAVLFLILVSFALVASALASAPAPEAPAPGPNVPACLTGSITADDTTATGHVSNGCPDPVRVNIISYEIFPDGSFTLYAGPNSQGVDAGTDANVSVAIAACHTKVILYLGDNPLDGNNQIARASFKTSIDCGGPTPTNTPPPPTKTPPPPTPTNTPVPPTPTPTPKAGGEGCTPGYWKQPHHFDSWMGYTPEQDYEAVFGVDASFTKTLLGALEQGGGGEKALGRHATAALLNAASADVSYMYSEAEVINMVLGAYASGDFNGVKNLFEAQNEAGCPLN